MQTQIFEVRVDNHVTGLILDLVRVFLLYSIYSLDEDSVIRHRSMRESEVQPLIPLIRRSCQINHLLFMIHAIPLSISVCISLHIVHLGPQIQDDVSNQNQEQDPITTFVPGRVVLLVDVGGDYARCLDAHVVESG
jgi:hypothetical protein